MSIESEKAEVARIMVGHSTLMRIHTGNIINWNMLKKHRFRKSMTSTDELMDALQCGMQSWIRNINTDPINIPDPRSVIDISNSDLIAPIDPEQREKVKVSVKLFLFDWRPELVRQAVHKVIQDLDIQRIDSVIISFPFILPPTGSNHIGINNLGSIYNMDKIKSIWSELESTVDSGHTVKIGVCDFDQDGLNELIEWSKIKPSTNQINFTRTCDVPNDLLQFSRSHKIDLLTHQDPPEILSARKFQSFMSETTAEIDSSSWTPAYVARYSVLVRYRGIVHSKGYIVSAERQNTSNGDENYGFF